MALAKLTVRLLIVAVPAFVPRVTVEAAPPMFKVVALTLKTEAVAADVVRLPPSTPTLPDVEKLPFAPLIDQNVPSKSFAPVLIAVPISESETSIAVVIPPAAD